MTVPRLGPLTVAWLRASNDGPVPTAVAMKLAQPGAAIRVTTNDTSTSRLSVVAKADTPA